MGRRNEGLKSYRHGSSVSETLLDVSNNVIDMIESRQRMSFLGYLIGYTFAAMTLFAFGFLGGVMFEDYHSDEQPPAPCGNNVRAKPSPSPPMYNPPNQVEASPDEGKRLESPLLATPAQPLQIAEDSDKYNDYVEQIEPRTSNAKGITTVWYPERRERARERLAPAATTADLPVVVKETRRQYIPDASREMPRIIERRPGQFNAKKGVYQPR